MTTIILNILLIATCCVIVTDLTDFQIFVKRSIRSLLTGGLSKSTDWRAHLIDCSLCQTFWLSITYIIIIGAFSFKTLALALLVAVSTPLIKDIICLVQDILTTIISLIKKILTKINR